MSTAQVVETSVTVNDNSPIQDYVHPDDQTQPTVDSASWTTLLLAHEKERVQTEHLPSH